MQSKQRHVYCHKLEFLFLLIIVMCSLLIFLSREYCEVLLKFLLSFLLWGQAQNASFQRSSVRLVENKTSETVLLYAIPSQILVNLRSLCLVSRCDNRMKSAFRNQLVN